MGARQFKPIKRYLKIEEQVDHLKNEGMQIENDEFAKEVLSKVNYYHLSGYWYKLYNSDNKFVEGVTFNTIYNVYQFDSELRRLITDLTELVEIKLRTQIANYIGEKWGPLGYRDLTNFHDKDRHIEFLYSTNKRIEKYQDKAIVKHHKEVYGGRLPVWAFVEILSFSDLTKLYRNFKTTDKKTLIRRYYKEKSITKNIECTGNWIRTLCDIRNICAHYERLYDYQLKSAIYLPDEYKEYDKDDDRLFQAIILLKLLINDNTIMTKFSTDLENLMKEFNFEGLDSMGFPEEWKTVLTK